MTCEVQKSEKDFPDGGPICVDCVALLNKLYGVEYTPPVRQTRLQACLNLILAVRNMSEVDGELEKFEKNWVESTPWNQLFGMVLESIRVSEAFKNASCISEENDREE